MSIARSGAGWFLAKILALGSSWVASMYFARVLMDPTATLGQFYVFETIVSLSMLVSNAGLNGAMSKRISEGENSEEYMIAGTVLSGVILVVVTILVALASPLVVDQVGGLGVLFIIGTLWAIQIRNKVSAVLKGHSQVGRSGGIGLFDTASRVVFQSALVFSGFGFLGLMGGAFAGASLAAVTSIIILAAGVPLPTLSRARTVLSAEYMWDLLSYAKYVFLSGFAGRFYDNIDIIVITAFLGPAATGVYGIGFRFSLLLSIASGAITTSSLPEISYHSAEGNVDRVEDILTDSIIFGTVLVIPATVGMAFISEPLIITVYTSEFRDAALIATIAVAIQIPDGLRSILTTTANAVDRPEFAFHTGFMIIVVNGLLDLLLVPTVGIVGAVIASFAAITLATIYLGYQLFRELGFSLTVLPVRPILCEIIAACIMGGMVWGLNQYVNLPPVPLLVVLITTGVGSYFAVLLTISVSVRERFIGIVADFVP